MSTTLVFWIVVAVLLLLALALLVPVLRRDSGEQERATRNELNAEVYRSQIDDLDRDLAEGSLDPAQHGAAREELRRRLLADAAEAEARPRRAAPRLSLVLVALGLPAAALGLYALIGSPGLVRLGAASPVPGLLTGATDPSTLNLAQPTLAQLREHLARNPGDGRAWVMAARMQAEREDWSGAAESYRRGIEASRKVAGDAGVLVEYADVLGQGQGGQLAGAPEALIKRALLLNGRHPRALELAGSAAFEQGRYAEAANYWKELLAQLPDSSAMREPLRAAIEQAQRRAGVDPG
jgi:cytochrome c-type biogenesis protein CcmH